MSLKNVFGSVSLLVVGLLAMGCGGGTCNTSDTATLAGTTYTEAQSGILAPDGETRLCDPALTVTFQSNIASSGLDGISVVVNDDVQDSGSYTETPLNITLFSQTATSYTTVGSAAGNFGIIINRTCSTTAGSVTLSQLSESVGDTLIGEFNVTGTSGTGCPTTPYAGTFSISRSELE